MKYGVADCRVNNVKFNHIARFLGNHRDKMDSDIVGRVSGYWKDLTEAVVSEERYHSWLALQCQLIPRTLSGVLLIRESNDSGEEAYVPVSKWPEKSGDVSGFADILNQVIERQCGLLTQIGDHCAIAYPVTMDGRLMAVAALALSSDNDAVLQAAMMQLQWGTSWLEVMFRRDDGRQKKADLMRLRSAVTLLAEVLSESRFQGAVMAFVNGLAAVLDCDRVSIGFAKGRKMEVAAFSHSAKFSDRMNLIRSVGKAMDEAVMQRRDIIFPNDAEKMMIVREHDHLSKQYGAGTLLTVLLYGHKRYYGAVTLERPAYKTFDEEDLAFVRNVAALSGPVLEDKRIADRPFIIKAYTVLKDQVKTIVGPRYLGRKLASLIISALLVFFYVAQGEYRITADAVLEGELKRAISAPFSGYIKVSNVRPGDIVKRDTVLCSLDDRDFRLERLNWRSQEIQLKRQYQEALARHSRAEVNIIDAKIKQVEAQLSLVENKLARTHITAPLDGIIISGDLTQSLGALVQRGDVLFEIAPADAYRLILKVDESRIADVTKEQTGRLVLSSFPKTRFDFHIVRITPLAMAEAGQNRFQVEARLEKPSDALRPGMEGVGKISVDRRNLFGIWTRGLFEKIRLWLWAWMP